MNFQFFAEKLKNSEQYKNFVKKNKDAFLCSCFFVIDRDEGKDKQHFDFYVPASNNILSFPLEFDSEPTPLEIKDGKTPTEVSIEQHFDLNDIEEMIKKKMKDEKIDKKIQKILLSLQNVAGKDFLVGTVFVSSLGLINVTIDIKQNNITDFKNKSFFDIMKVVKKDD